MGGQPGQKAIDGSSRQRLMNALAPPARMDREVAVEVEIQLIQGAATLGEQLLRFRSSAAECGEMPSCGPMQRHRGGACPA
jgi:hypothetical protein